MQSRVDGWESAKDVYPIYAEITTSAACPHRCVFCSTDAIGYPAINIDADILRDRLQEMGWLGVKSVMYAGTGEPLLHKKINRIVGDSRAAGLEVAFTTNGVLLHKLDAIAECSWVKISFNGGTRENYAEIHRTSPKDWDSIWRHLPGVVARKGKCALGMQAVVLPENYKTMDNLARLAKDAGVDYFVLKPYSQATFSIVQRDDIDYRVMEGELLGLPDKYDTDTFKVIYRANAIAQEREKKHKYSKCNATPFFWVYFMANGDVFTCSAHLLDERFKIGNINEQSFSEIWTGERRHENWKLMKETFDVKECRLNCRQNANNVFLDQLANGIPHQSFI